MESALTLLFLLVVASVNVWAVRVGRTGSSAHENRAFSSGLLGLVMLSVTLSCSVFWAAGLILMEMSETGSSYKAPAGIAMIASGLTTLFVTLISLVSAHRSTRSTRNAAVA